MRASRLWSRRVVPASVAWGFGGFPRRWSRVWVVLVALGGLALAGMTAAAGASASTGGVYAWGYNAEGQLGDGTTTSSPTPVAVALPSGVTATAVAAGVEHSLALTSTGQVYAWGDNTSGELGDGTRSTCPGGTPLSSPTPVAVNLPSGVTATAIAAGSFYSLALTSTGQVYAWGSNYYGQLGNGGETGPCFGIATPALVHLPSGVTVTAIAAGEDHSLALTSTGQVYAWGDNNTGEIGNGSTSLDCPPHCTRLPVAVHLPSGVTATAIAAGFDHSLAVTSTGQAYAWGDNSNGELGDGTTTGPQTCPGGVACSPTPVAVLLPSGVRATAVAAGRYDSLALTRSGHVWAWGENGDGELGDGNVISRTTPAPVRLFAPGSGVTATAIAAGLTFQGLSLALTSSGQMYAWGYNGDGELGIGTTTGPQSCGGQACSLTPVAVNLPSGVTATAIGAGSEQGLAVDP